MDNGSFYIGTGKGMGTYTLSGDATLDTGVTAYIGRTGGTGNLTLKDNASMNMDGGDVWMTIGTSGTTADAGTGTIRQEGNSEVNISIGGGITFGDGAGSHGAYELAGGSATLISTRGDAASGIRLGQTAGSTGEFTQSGGTSVLGGRLVALGYAGSGTFTLSDGTATVQTGIVLGELAGGDGTFNLDGGVLEIGGTNGIRKGEGSASFNLGGGTLRVLGSALTTSVKANLVDSTTTVIDTAGGAVTFADGFTGTGGFSKIGANRMTVGGSTTLSADSSIQGNFEINGSSASPASFTVAAGTTLDINSLATGGTTIWVGSGVGNEGVLNLNETTVDVNLTGASTTTLLVGGDGGTGTVNMDGGSFIYHPTSSYGRIFVGTGAGSKGTFNQHNGSVDVANGSFNLGIWSGVGVYNLTGNASLDPGVTVYIGHGAGGSGTLSLSDTSSYEMTGNDVWATIGEDDGIGIIRQQDQSNVVFDIGGKVVFGTEAAGRGTYELNDGTLTLTARGAGGATGVYFGMTAGSTGEFIQSGGTSFMGTKLVHFGHEGTGIFTLSGGTATVEKGIVLGALAGGDGTLNLDGGILEVGGTNGIRKGAGSAEVNLSGGKLRVYESDLTSAVDLTLTAGKTSAIDTNALNATLSGKISGAGNVVKEGDGILTLEGDNDYTGTTNVTDGTLKVGAGGKTGTGAVTIGADGALAGTGIVQGAATVYGRLNPGNSPGDLTFAQGLTLEAGSNTTLEILGSAAGEYDTLSITSGDLTLGGALTLDVASLAIGTYSFNLFDLEDGVLLLENFDSVLLTGTYGSAAFDWDGSSWTLEINEQSFAFNSQVGTLDVVVAIPEPGSWALLGSAAVLGWVLRRRLL